MSKQALKVQSSLAPWVKATSRFSSVLFAAYMLCVGSAYAGGGSPAAELSLPARIKIAAEIRTDIEQYFAHWQGVPNLDFESTYSDYVDTISKTADRKSFDFATIALFATLRNGHTKYFDQWLWENYGQPTGLIVHYRSGQWVVLNSRRSQIVPGTIIVGVDGEPIDAYFAEKSKYISGSDELARRNHLFNTGYLFSSTFTITTNQGSIIAVNRLDPGTPWRNPASTGDFPIGVSYTRIRSFGAQHFEDDAVAFIKAHAAAKTIIIDVRMNGGGSTPNKLIDALITSPYTDWTEASAMSVGLLKTYGQFLPQVNPKEDPEDHGFDQGMNSYFSRPMMYWPGQTHKPHSPVFHGRLIVLIDSDCASACEDFVMPLKVTHRAILIGERTFGSSGQPFERTVSNSISYTIGAKRMFYGDGTPFEGVGIEPDIAISGNAAQLQNNEDPVLKEAINQALK